MPEKENKIVSIQSGVRVEPDDETTITVSLEGEEILVSFSLPAKKIRTLLLGKTTQ